jgi:hypothetical protein
VANFLVRRRVYVPMNLKLAVLTAGSNTVSIAH